jgi:hypothetical protein
MKFKSIGTAKKITGLAYLGSCNSSAKIVKNQKYNVSTYIIYLAPAKLSGYNVCPMATGGDGITLGCIDGCLNFSGHEKISNMTDTGYSKITNTRIKKTKMFFEHRTFFVDWTIAEIKKYKAAAERKGEQFSVRINGTSDLSIETMRNKEGKNLLELFPDVQFYDYTKVFNRLPLTKKYPNYHLTFSYSGANMVQCLAALADGYNVAMVFNKALPDTYMGYKVVNADDSDLRYLDEKNVICGLVFKKVRNKTANVNNTFVVNI